MRQLDRRAQTQDPPPINFPKLPITTLFEMILGPQRYEKMLQLLICRYVKLNIRNKTLLISMSRELITPKKRKERVKYQF